MESLDSSTLEPPPPCTQHPKQQTLLELDEAFRATEVAAGVRCLGGLAFLVGIRGICAGAPSRSEGFTVQRSRLRI